MKTLTKLCPKRSTLPILTAIKVENGIAYSTDLDMVIAEPIVSTPDGLYHAEGFADGMRVPFTVHPIEDFPMLRAPQKPLGESTLSSDDLAFVLQCVSEDATRYYMNGVCFKENSIAASDGHRLAKITFEESFPAHPEYEQGVIIPTQACELFISLCKEFKQSEAKVEFYVNLVKFSVGNASLTTKMIDGAFPDTDRVTPGDAKHKTDFNPKDFAAKQKELRAMARIAGNRRNNTIVVAIGDKTSHSTFTTLQNITFPVSASLPEETRFNLDYLLSMTPGKLHWNDANSPIKVTNGNRLNVLMPCRL